MVVSPVDKPMIRIALAQQDFPVGDMAGNLARVEAGIELARKAGADLVLFPEMAISGYPPEDLLLRPGFMYRCHDVVNELVGKVHGIDVLVGHPWMEDGKRYNAVSWIRNGQVLGRYFKQALPNYKVFDEQRYFTEGSEPLGVELKGCRFGVLICEDAWVSGPAVQAKAAGAELLLLTNASPYCVTKLAQRLDTLQARHRDIGLPVVYSNLVGGQDELVFDGRSMLMSGNGSFNIRHEPCSEAMLMAEFDPASGRLKFEGDHSAGLDARQILEGEDATACIYEVLVRGLHDYITKNGFNDVVIGLSGGIDSALTLALAVDALGAEHVHAVMMPSRHTTDLSVGLAREQAEMLGVEYREISIEPGYQALLDAMQPSFAGRDPGITEENIQARIRGTMLMALSNKFGWLVLATGNKSELAVGYSTIYGDMCGGFSPIKDCMKTRVYELSRYRNTLSPAIPEAVIERKPSAELAPDQFDQDSLPPYEILDQILIRYIEQDWSIARIVRDGFEEPVVRRVAGLVIGNEYKRRQGASGVRITSRAFGRDRRYPITSGWHEESIKEI